MLEILLRTLFSTEPSWCHECSGAPVQSVTSLSGPQLDFWLHPVSTELPVDIRVPQSSLSLVTEYLHTHAIPYSVIINNLQVCSHLSTHSDKSIII